MAEHRCAAGFALLTLLAAGCHETEIPPQPDLQAPQVALGEMGPAVGAPGDSGAQVTGGMEVSDSAVIRDEALPLDLAAAIDFSVPSPPPCMPIPRAGAHIELDTGTVQFGSMHVGTKSPPETISIISAGKAPLTVSAILIGGPNRADYQVAIPQLPAVLQPGSTTTFTLWFAPHSKGNLVADVDVCSDDPGQPVAHVNLLGNSL